MTPILRDLWQYIVLFPLPLAFFSAVMTFFAVLWWSQRKNAVEKPVWFEVEYTENIGYVMRPVVPEAIAWAEENIADLRLPDSGNYKITRAWVGVLWATGVKRGWRVNVIAWAPTEQQKGA